MPSSDHPHANNLRCQSRFDRSTLRLAVDLIERGVLVSVSSVICFGSHANRRVAAVSDIDLMVISAAPPFSSLFEMDGQVFDIVVNTYDGFCQRLSEETPINNNFILNGLQDAEILLDIHGDGLRLIDYARHKYKAGPSQMSAALAENSAKALLRLLHTVEKLTSRTSTSIQASIFARMRCDQLVIRAVYAYCKANALWASSFPDTISSLEFNEPKLYQLWCDYVVASSSEVQLGVAKQIISISLASISHRKRESLHHCSDHLMMPDSRKREQWR